MLDRKLVLLAVQVLSAVCALAAAGLWFAASVDSIAERVLDAMRARGGMDVLGSDMDALVQAFACDLRGSRRGGRRSYHSGGYLIRAETNPLARGGPFLEWLDCAALY